METKSVVETLEMEIGTLNLTSDAWVVGSVAVSKYTSLIKLSILEIEEYGEVTEETNKKIRDAEELLRGASEFVSRKRMADEGARDVVEELKAQQDAYNDGLKELNASYALGDINMSEYNAEMAELKETYPAVIKLQELMSGSLEANTKAVQDFYKETGILVDSLKELVIMQDLLAKGKIDKDLHPGRKTPTGPGGEKWVNIGTGDAPIWAPPPPTPPTGRGPTAVHPIELQDFISRPGQPLQKFSPDDTVIGVKKTGGSMGGGGNKIDININGYNRDQKSLAIEVKRQILSLA